MAGLPCTGHLVWGCTRSLEVRLKSPHILRWGLTQCRNVACQPRFHCLSVSRGPTRVCRVPIQVHTGRIIHHTRLPWRYGLPIQLRFAFVTRADPQPVSRSLSNTTGKVSPASRCTRCQPCRVQRFPRYSTTSAFSPLAPFFNSSGRSPASPCARWGAHRFSGAQDSKTAPLPLKNVITTGLPVL